MAARIAESFAAHEASSIGESSAPSGYPCPPPPSQPSPPEYQSPPPPPPQLPLPPPTLEPGEEDDDASLHQGWATPGSDSTLPEADFGSDSDHSVPEQDVMDDESTAPTVNDLGSRLIEVSLQSRHGSPLPDHAIFGGGPMDWRRHRPWDPMSSTPGRQSLAVQNWWREQDRQAALAWMSGLARVDETDASSTAVELDSEYADSHEARRAAYQALENHRASRGPGSFEAQQFTWTFRCPDSGCGWAEESEDDVELCPRCLGVARTTQPMKFRTFLNKVCEECYDNHAKDWFYFCHLCLECTWKSRCCSTNTSCVDVRALKRAQQRRI